jgi:hypothetical protein
MCSNLFQTLDTNLPDRNSINLIHTLPGGATEEDPKVSFAKGSYCQGPLKQLLDVFKLGIFGHSAEEVKHFMFLCQAASKTQTRATKKEANGHEETIHNASQSQQVSALRF